MDHASSQHSVICQWGHWDTTPFSPPLGPGIHYNPTCIAIHHLVLNPGTICKEILKDVHYAYRQPLQQSHIVIEDNMLILWELIQENSSYTCLQILPNKLQYPFHHFLLKSNWWSFECIQNSPLPPDAIPLAGNVLIRQTGVSCLPWVRTTQPVLWDFIWAHLSLHNQGAIPCPFCWCVLCWEIFCLWRKWSLPHCFMRYDGLFCYGN